MKTWTFDCIELGQVRRSSCFAVVGDIILNQNLGSFFLSVSK